MSGPVTRESRAGLVTESLSIGYHPRPALVQDLQLEAPRGDLVAVVGPNGSGKSTLLRVLAGLQPPLEGRVNLDGLDIHHLDFVARARLIGIGLPHHETPPHLRVRELVSLGRYPYTSWLGGLSETDRGAVDDALKTTGISALADREVATLSDGEAQKAHIARGVAQEAPLLVLDEPTAYLDVTSRFEITHMLRDLAHREDRLVVFSTHDLAIARETADRMWLFVPAGAAAAAAADPAGAAPAAGPATAPPARLVQGAPEDLALGGMIREAFSRHGVSFTEDGSPAGRPPNRYPHVSVEVAGAAGTRTDWTRRAIRRAGFAESAPGHRSAEPETVTSLRVTVFEDQWVVETEGEEPEYANSILELVGRLRRRTREAS